jgi:hypothetical protein
VAQVATMGQVQAHNAVMGVQQRGVHLDMSSSSSSTCLQVT